MGWAWPRHPFESSRKFPTYTFHSWNKNEREQLGSGYVSEMKMKILPESCSSKCVDNLAAKKWERDFLQPNLSQNPMKTQEKFVRGSVWEREWKSECEWNTPLSQPLFKGERVKAHKERPATTVREPLVNVGPRSRWPWVGRPVGSAGPRVGPLLPPFGQILFQQSYALELWCTANIFWKRCPNYFSKRFETQKIILLFL